MVWSFYKTSDPGPDREAPILDFVEKGLTPVVWVPPLDVSEGEGDFAAIRKWSTLMKTAT